MPFLGRTSDRLDKRKRSRTPGGRRRGAGAAVGAAARGGSKRRRPPPPVPQPFMGPGYKVGGPVPEINDAVAAKYQRGGRAMAPTISPGVRPPATMPRFPSRPSMQSPPPNMVNDNATRERLAAEYARSRSGYGMPPGMGARGRATPPALGPQRPRRRGRGRGGRDV